MSSVLKFLKFPVDALQILSNLVNMLSSIIKACIKNFRAIVSVFLKLQYSKILDSPYEESWCLVIW